MTRTIIGYRTIDARTGETVAEKACTEANRTKVRSGLTRGAERRNQRYGAHRYDVQPVWSDQG